MPQGTLPPHFSARAWSNHIRAQVPVQNGMPLGGQLGEFGGQVVKARQHLPARAVRAAAFAHGTGCHSCLVRMSPFALPPHLAVGAGCDLLWGQRSIFSGVPLSGQLGKLSGQIVFSRNHFSSAAHRATAAGYPGVHRRLPLMALFTPPPDLAGTAGCQGFRPECSVFGGMPLGRQKGILAGQVVFMRMDFPAGTHWTAATGYPGLDLSLPLMTFFTEPPHLAVAAGQDLIRGECAVFGRMPFMGQLRIERR